MANSYNELFGLGSHSEDANLEGWWLLQDDAANDVIDDASSNGNDGNVHAGTTSAVSTTGPNSFLTKAIDFSVDSNRWTHHPTGDLSGGGSIACRFKLTATPPTATEIIIGHRNGGTDSRVYLQVTTSRVLTIVYADLVSDTGSTLTLDQWYDLALVWSSGTLTLYLDGSQDAQATGGSFSGGWGEFGFGAYTHDAGEIDGIGSEICAFDDQLTSGEIAEFNAGPEPVVTSGSDSVSGTETEGQTLSASGATWGLDAPFASGSNGTITYTYQWTRSDNGSGLNEADISGATSSTYTLVSADVGKYIRRRTRASNDGGADTSADHNSTFTGAIAASGGGSTNPKGIFGLALSGPFAGPIFQ